MTASDTALFPPEIETFRVQIEARLDRYTQFDGECPDRLREAMRYALLAPGKRIRPLLVLTAAHICGGDIQNALPSACAVEMIHAYSLIHDDLPAMDDDDIRRGRPTVHIAYDEATAILAGDALIPLALEIISRDTQPASVAATCVTRLARAAGPCHLVGGQVDDLNPNFSQTGDQVQPPGVEQLERIHRRKTGSLLAVSLELGALTAGASEQDRGRLIEYGQHLGLAFQIVDDLLDLRATDEELGKRTGKDAEAGKLTYPAVLGEEKSEQRAREMAAAAMAAIEPFGDKARSLNLLAQFVVDRTR
jgi:geranylgeranyl diphosphate synthase type II